MSLPAAYEEYALATDDAYTNAMQVREAVTERNFALRRMLEGKDDAKVLQNGKTIKNFLQLDDKSTAHFFGAGGTESPTDPQVVTDMSTPWAFIRDDITYDMETINLHEGDTAQMFFNLKHQYEQKCMISKIRFLETTGLWGTPNEATMEATTPTNGVRHMQTIPVLVNELDDSLPDEVSTWSTVQGIDSSVKTGWQNQRKAYDGNSTGANADLLKAISYMSRKVEFTGLPLGYGAYSDKRTMPAVVWSSLEGVMWLEHLMRATQDSFVYLGRQDPTYPNPTVRGIPVEDVDYMVSANIFPTGTSGAYSTEDDTTNDASSTHESGPRYLFMNLMDIYFVLHSDIFFYRHKPRTPYHNPSRTTIYIDTYANLTAEQRRTSGTVYPNAAVPASVYA